MDLKYKDTKYKDTKYKDTKYKDTKLKRMITIMMRKKYTQIRKNVL